MIIERHEFKVRGYDPVAQYTFRTTDGITRRFFVEQTDDELKGVRLPKTVPLYRLIIQQFPSVRWGGDSSAHDLYMSAADIVVLEMLVGRRTVSDVLGG